MTPNAGQATYYAKEFENHLAHPTAAHHRSR